MLFGTSSGGKKHLPSHWSMFPKGIPHHNNIGLAKLGKRNMVSFKANEDLTKTIA